MALTITEKEHWKTRISEKIERRVKDLVAAQQPSYLDDVAKQARDEVTEELGISELLARCVAARAEIQRMQEEVDELSAKAAARVTGESIERRRTVSYNNGSAIECRIQQLIPFHERELMKNDKLGRQILKLRNEQEELLDTVWLATSSREIRSLWHNVAQLLGESPTELQAAALESNPNVE